MVKQSTADNLADLVEAMGGTTRGGETTAQLIDMLETLAPGGSATDIEGWLAAHTGHVSDGELDGIFGA